MIIDCDTCTAVGTEACNDCIVTALSAPGAVLELSPDERAAIDTMSAVGLVSPIRLVTSEERQRRTAS